MISSPNFATNSSYFYFFCEYFPTIYLPRSPLNFQKYPLLPSVLFPFVQSISLFLHPKWCPSMHSCVNYLYCFQQPPTNYSLPLLLDQLLQKQSAACLHLFKLWVAGKSCCFLPLLIQFRYPLHFRQCCSGRQAKNLHPHFAASNSALSPDLPSHQSTLVEQDRPVDPTLWHFEAF